MLLRLFVILSTADEEDELRVKEKIKDISNELSYSPSRNSPYSTGVDFFVSGNVDRKTYDDICKKLTDFYIGDYNSWTAHDFNAELFDKSVCEIQMEYYDD